MLENQEPLYQGEFLSTDNKSKLYEALAKAQGEFPAIEKNSKVDVYSKPPNRTLAYTYFYADLTEIINKTRPVLSKNGISFTQGMGSEGFYTMLMHSSGECFKAGIIPTQIKANDYKEMASAITYLKRISLSAALGISADEDIDAAESEALKGNSTKKESTKGNYDPKKSKPKEDVKNHAPKPETPQQRLLKIVKNKNIPNEDMPDIIFRCTGEHLKSSDLSHGQVDVIIDYLNMRDI